LELKKWRNDKNIEYSDDELYAYLIEQERGIIFISGPTMCGKTKMLNRIKNKNESNMSIISEEYLVTCMLGDCPNSSVPKNGFFETFDKKILGVEEIDFLAGKQASQETAGDIFNGLINDGVLVIVSGIKIKEKVQFLINTVKKNTVDFFIFLDE